tara:strand:- start:65 stop:442 length:378 start_codon:yes stop_codon:yes gene_type:complete
MNYSKEIIIVLLLGLLVFKVPPTITEYANTILGKAALLASVVYITKTQGLLCGSLTALVMVILIHHSFEGMKEGVKNRKRRGKTGDRRTNKKKKAGTIQVVQEDMRNMENSLKRSAESASMSATS